MPIIVDTQQFVSQDASSTTLTFSHTCSGSQRLLVITVPDSRSTAINSVTYNGTALSVGKANSNADNWARIYYLVAPATGANDVVITYASALTFRQAGAISFNGIDQGSPLGGTSEVDVSGTNVSISITTTKIGSVIIDSIGNNGSNMSPQSGQTVIGSQSTGLNRISGYKIVTNPTVYTHTWNGTSSQSQALAACEFRSADLTLGEYLGAGSETTKLLLHLNGNSTDSSGNGNNGTDTSITYSQANGKFGQGAGFGSSNSTIALGYTAPTDNYTYSLWVKPTDYTAQRSLINNFTNPSSGRNIYLATKITTGYVFVDIPYIKGDILISPSAPTTGVWTNIILTRSGSAWRLYFNGNLVQSATDSTSQESTTSCIIGNVTTQNITFGGAIDEVIIENRAWSASEIKKYYTNSRGMFHLT